MKKLLILGIYLEPTCPEFTDGSRDYFPHYVSVGGLRSYNWYNENGITPFVFA
jgi:hypothetical protein